MKAFAISLSLLLLCPAWTHAGILQQSDTNVSECEGLSKACSAAAKELAAARKYILGLEQNIEAAEERIGVARKEIETLKGIGALEKQKAAELQTVIDAERQQVKILTQQKELYEKRVKTLEGQLKRSRKLTLVLGVTAAVGILISIAR